MELARIGATVSSKAKMQYESISVHRFAASLRPTGWNAMVNRL